MNEPIIRPCRPEDRETVIDIANRAWRPINAAYRTVYGDELFALLFPNPETRVGKNVKAGIEKYPGQTIACEAEGKIVGFCNYWFDEEKKIGIISYNAVDPDCGLKGIGQRMYKAVLDKFRQRGMLYAKVHTCLDDGHAPARRAYERAGFDISHGSADYYMKLRKGM